MGNRLRPNQLEPVDLNRLYKPDEAVLDLSKPATYTFVLINGAFKASYWYRFARIMTEAGHNVVEPVLPIHDPDATFEDDTEAVRQAIADRENIIFMPHSRGIETARVLSTEDLGRFVATQIVSSGGPHFYEPDLSLGQDDRRRYSRGYKKALIEEANNMSRISPEDALRYLFDDVENEELAAAAAEHLLLQRNSDSDNSPPFDLPTAKLPTTVWLGAHDQALNIQRAYRIFEQWAHISPELLDAGHTPQLSMPAILARYCIDFANRAYKDPESLLATAV